LREQPDRVIPASLREMDADYRALNAVAVAWALNEPASNAEYKRAKAALSKLGF
jgi:hypothetical protein